MLHKTGIAVEVTVTGLTNVPPVTVDMPNHLSWRLEYVRVWGLGLRGSIPGVAGGGRVQEDPPCVWQVPKFKCQGHRVGVPAIVLYRPGHIAVPQLPG